MTITINNLLIVLCLFYFFLSAFLSYLFKQANIFLKLVVFFFIMGLFVSIESTNRIEVTIASVLGFLFIYADTALDFLFGVKLGIETVLFGFFGMIKRLLLFILLPIANCFTWFYNLLSRFFGWNLKFHRLDEPMPKDREESSRRPRRRHWKHKDETPNRNQTRHEQKNQHRDSNRGKYSFRRNRHDKASRDETHQHQYSRSADKQKQDAINRAKEEVKQAREQNKRKEEQRQGSTGGHKPKPSVNTDDKRTAQQILGLNDNFTLAELSKAYKIGLARYHPDKYSHMSEDFQKEAQAEFIKIKNAYNVLIKGFN